MRGRGRSRYDFLVVSLAVVGIAATILMAGEVTYEYDSNNRLKTASYPNGVTSRYRYDPAHNLLGIGHVEDSDGDGLPDYWEIKYFGNLTTTDGTGDQDGDGLTDLEEYLAASDPTSASSSFVFYGSPPSPTTFIVRWASASNRTYTINYTTNLMESFSVLATNVVGTPPVNEYSHTIAAFHTFYRVELEAQGGAE